MNYEFISIIPRLTRDPLRKQEIAGQARNDT